MPRLRRRGHSARAVVTAAVVSIIVCAGCSGGSGTPVASQAIFITSHLDRETVSGAITLRGTGSGSVEVDTHVFFRQIEATDMFSIGYGYFGFFDGWWRFHGEIDDVRIYDRPLSKLEVKALASEA